MGEAAVAEEVGEEPEFCDYGPFNRPVNVAVLGGEDAVLEFLVVNGGVFAAGEELVGVVGDGG